MGQRQVRRAGHSKWFSLTQDGAKAEISKEKIKRTVGKNTLNRGSFFRFGK